MTESILCTVFRSACWQRLGSTLIRIDSFIAYPCIISSRPWILRIQSSTADILVTTVFSSYYDSPWLQIEFTCAWGFQCVACTTFRGSLGTNLLHTSLRHVPFGSFWIILDRVHLRWIFVQKEYLIRIFYHKDRTFSYFEIVDIVKVEFLPKFSVSGIWNRWKDSYPREGVRGHLSTTVFTGVCFHAIWCKILILWKVFDKSSHLSRVPTAQTSGELRMECESSDSHAHCCVSKRILLG